jgi:hypothetical protein
MGMLKMSTEHQEFVKFLSDGLFSEMGTKMSKQPGTETSQPKTSQPKISEKTKDFIEKLREHANELKKQGKQVTLEELVKKIVSLYQDEQGNYIDIKKEFQFPQDETSIGIAIEYVLKENETGIEKLIELFKPTVEKFKEYYGSDEETVRIMSKNIIVEKYGELYYRIVSGYIEFAIRKVYDEKEKDEGIGIE